MCDLATDDFDGAVAALRRAELIHEESLYPEVEYAFRHPLTHEVAERSQLAAQRRRVHVAVARALAELHADKADENAALLAHHWDLGGEVEPAARWHRRAAEWITGSNAPEARRHWQRVRELADRIGDAALAAELGQQSRLMILEYGWRLGMSEEEANELLEEGEAWARRHDDSRGLAALYNAFAIPAAFVFGDPGRARELSAAGLRLAEEAGDGPLSCALELRLYFSALAFGRVPDEAAAMKAVLRRSAEDMERASPLVGYDVPALWWERGDGARALVAARESLDIAEPIDSAISQGMALQVFGRSLALAGDAAAAVSALERAQPFLARTILHFEPEALSDLALAHCSLGALAEAEAAAERALDRAARCSAFRGEVLALHALAAVHLARGGDAVSLAEAQRLLDRAESRAAEIGYGLILPRLHERRADLALQRGDAAAAKAALREAQRLYQEIGAPLHVERLAQQIG